MEISSVTDLISTLGFPIACVIALGWFAWYMVQHMSKTNADNMLQVQERCKAREDKLYEEIKKNREVNAEAIATIQLYAERLTHIESDIDDVKTDVTVIKNKVS